MGSRTFQTACISPGIHVFFVRKWFRRKQCSIAQKFKSSLLDISDLRKSIST